MLLVKLSNFKNNNPGVLLLIRNLLGRGERHGTNQDNVRERVAKRRKEVK